MKQAQNNQQQIKETYSFIKKIARGHYGTVYLVQSNLSGEKYALKQVPLENLSEQEIENTYNEIKLLKKLDHPNIVRFKQVFKSTKPQNSINIIQEFAEGGDLSKIIETNRKQIEENTLIDWLTQICSALKYIHSQKVIHRDIKPLNIFLNSKRQIKLGDFGISKLLNNTIHTKSFVGTTYYFSPEMINGEAYSFETDIWSLGVSFYELMTFRKPFDGITQPAIFLRIMKGEYEPISNNYTYSNDLKKCVYQMLSIDPKKRPTANDIIHLPFVKNRMRSILLQQNFNIVNSNRLINNFRAKFNPNNFYGGANKNLFNNGNNNIEKKHISDKFNLPKLSDKKIAKHLSGDNQEKEKEIKLLGNSNIKITNNIKAGFNNTTSNDFGSSIKTNNSTNCSSLSTNKEEVIEKEPIIINRNEKNNKPSSLPKIKIIKMSGDIIQNNRSINFEEININKSNDNLKQKKKSASSRSLVCINEDQKKESQKDEYDYHRQMNLYQSYLDNKASGEIEDDLKICSDSNSGKKDNDAGEDDMVRFK